MEATRETTRSRVAEDGPSAHPTKVPVIVLAGDRQGSHPVFGRNKNLLKIGGEPSVAHVVRTLLEVEEVEATYVVGPEAELKRALAPLSTAAGRSYHVVSQRETVVQNCFRGFRRSLSSAEPPPDLETLKAERPDAVALFVTGDLPLLNAHEIRHFVQNADMRRYDYVLGLTPRAAIDSVVVKAEVPELSKPSLHMAEGRLRQNNLQMIRPFAIRHLEYFDRFYNVRYQKEFWNSVRVAAAIVGASGGISRPLGYYLFAQAAMRAQLHGWTRWADWFRRRVPMDGVCAAMSRFMEARFTFLTGPCPGAALDIDSERDLELTETHLEKLRAVLAERWRD